jgi:hypothetical protein
MVYPSIWIRLISALLGLFLFAGCGSSGSQEGLPKDETLTLRSLKKLDDYPLYTMKYVGEYALQTQVDFAAVSERSPRLAWGCSLFATLSDRGERLYGRNYDWRFSPALLLFTDPPDGYASVSMVDLEYLGFEEEQVGNLMGLSLSERKPLLEAYRLPFDGMNEQGLAIGMAAVPPGDMKDDPEKPIIGQLMAIREILDHASKVEEAVTILGSYNIDMSEVPIHYLIGSADGQAALVEFYQGKMVVTRNVQPWMVATNFLVAATAGNPAGQCWRYDRIQERMDEVQGLLTSAGALDLLGEVAQDNTQWSVIYNMDSGEVQVVMGQQYQQELVRLNLAMEK